MKKLYFFMLSLFLGTASFAQGPLYIYNNSTHDIQIQVQALGSNNDPNTAFSCYYLILPAGSISEPTIYTFTNFNILAPPSLDSQFTEWTRAVTPAPPAPPYPISYTNLPKSVAQSTYAPLPSYPIWNLVKFNVLGENPGNILGTGGIAKAGSDHYPTLYPAAFGPTPGTPMPQGSSFSAVWFTLGTQTIVTFSGS